MTDFIGASLGDLQIVNQGFYGLRDTAVDSGKTVKTTCSNSVETLKIHTRYAKRSCLNSITGMEYEFVKVRNVLENAKYKGANAITAKEAATDMDARSKRAVADMTAAFDEFSNQIDALGADLEEIATAYDRYTVAAGDSAQSMSDAMKAQRENLDAAMRGMTY